MTFGYVTWTEPQLSIADEIKIADAVRARGTWEWTKKLFSDQSGQIIWMAFILLVFFIYVVIVDAPAEVSARYTALMVCVFGFYFATVLYAALKQYLWLRRLVKKYPAGSKPPPPPPKNDGFQPTTPCTHCDGKGSVEVLLSNEGGTVLTPCRHCHGRGRV